MTTKQTQRPYAVDALELRKVIAASYNAWHQSEYGWDIPDESALRFSDVFIKYLNNNKMSANGLTITSSEPTPLPDDVEAALERLKLAAEEMPQEDDYYFEAAARDDKILRAHIAALTEKNTTLRNAAEIGLEYVLAAQRGLTFTKPRMASDVEVFNDALKMGGDE